MLVGALVPVRDPKPRCNGEGWLKRAMSVSPPVISTPAAERKPQRQTRLLVIAGVVTRGVVAIRVWVVSVWPVRVWLVVVPFHDHGPVVVARAASVYLHYVIRRLCSGKDGRRGHKRGF